LKKKKKGKEKKTLGRLASCSKVFEFFCRNYRHLFKNILVTKRFKNLFFLEIFRSPFCFLVETIATNVFGKQICFSRNYRHLLLDAFGDLHHY